MNTFTFQPGLTWRKAGFAFFSDSLAYREVLNANPFWDITRHPAPGSSLYKPEDNSPAAGLTMRGATVNVNYAAQGSQTYYPFQTEQEYQQALARYPVASLSETERNNGWTSTSSVALYGQQ